MAVVAVLLIGAVELQAVIRISDVASTMGLMAFFIFMTFPSLKIKHSVVFLKAQQSVVFVKSTNFCVSQVGTVIIACVPCWGFEFIDNSKPWLRTSSRVITSPMPVPFALVE